MPVRRPLPVSRSCTAGEKVPDSSSPSAASGWLLQSVSSTRGAVESMTSGPTSTDTRLEWCPPHSMPAHASLVRTVSTLLLVCHTAVMADDVEVLLAHVDRCALVPVDEARGWDHMGAVITDAVLQQGTS